MPAAGETGVAERINGLGLKGSIRRRLTGFGKGLRVVGRWRESVGVRM